MESVNQDTDAIVVPENVKRTKKDRTPAQLQALAKGRDAHVEKSKLRRESEKQAQHAPQAPASSPIDFPELPRRREETKNFEELGELKKLKRELKEYKNKQLVRNMVEVELKRVKEIKNLVKKEASEKVAKKDEPPPPPAKPEVRFITRKYGAPIVI
jgi:hypothetical protein